MKNSANSKSPDREFERWKQKYVFAKDAFEEIKAKMDKREKLYRGTREIDGANGGQAKDATHVRNIIFENIEAQIDPTIPRPKVQAKRKEDEPLARKIENMLRNKLDQLPFEMMNDLQERTVPIQGGAYFLIEWDNTRRKHGAVGDITVCAEHPKQVIPQPGIYTSVEEMDYIFLESAQTKDYVKRRYGKDVSNESESVPEIRSMTEDGSKEIVTVVTGYFRNGSGGIGRIVFVNDTLLEYLEDYQARYLYRCRKCGKPGKDRCEYCNSNSFELCVREEEEIFEDLKLPSGSVFGQRKIPFYKPDMYPVILRKNVSVYGQLLGNSDVDCMSDQQNDIKKLSTKISEKLLKGGSILTLPSELCVETTDEEFKIVRVDSPDKMNMMRVFNVQADISGDLTYLSQLYDEARQTIGITDSFQGRNDVTAISGVAKKFAAAQTAGRLESKRVMKQAAYASLFELMFKYMLAYADEPRPVTHPDDRGNTKYEEFNRYDFLREDSSGELYWNDDFVFSCDTTSTLDSNREAMWEETRKNLAEGVYGPPSSVDTLILFWRNMELLHYPGASETKRFLTENGIAAGAAAAADVTDIAAK